MSHPHEEHFRKARHGDAESIDWLVKQNLALVNHILRRFPSSGFDREDLYQVGCIGLIKAVRNFRPELGGQFSTYAVPVILGEIRNYLRSEGPVKVSRDARQMVRRARQIESDMREKLGRSPTVHELAQQLAVSPEELLQAMEASQTPLSLNEPLFEEESETLMDQLSDAEQDTYGRNLDSLALQEAMAQLDERLQQIIRLRFFEEKTQQEIADLLNISQVQVSRLEKKALMILRTFIA